MPNYCGQRHRSKHPPKWFLPPRQKKCPKNSAKPYIGQEVGARCQMKNLVSACGPTPLIVEGGDILIFGWMNTWNVQAAPSLFTCCFAARIR